VIDFDEELKKFKPAIEVNDAEEVIAKTDITDMVDILKMITEEKKAAGKKSDEKKEARLK
jgi:hypothetical protein